MATRDELIRCGVEMLERDGLEGISLRRIAAHAGVSHGAPRHHFPTYGALLGAIARSGVDDLDAHLTPAWVEPNPRNAIRIAAFRYLDFAHDRPEMFTLIHRHDLVEGQGGHLREVTATWFAAVVERVERAAPATAQVNAHAAVTRASAIWAGVHGIAMLGIRRTGEPVMSGGLDVQLSLDVLLDGLLPVRHG